MAALRLMTSEGTQSSVLKCAHPWSVWYSRQPVLTPAFCLPLSVRFLSPEQLLVCPTHYRRHLPHSHTSLNTKCSVLMGKTQTRLERHTQPSRSLFFRGLHYNPRTWESVNVLYTSAFLAKTRKRLQIMY